MNIVISFIMFYSSDCLSSNLRQTISVIYTRGSTSAALSKPGSGPGGSEGQRSSSTAVTSVQGGAGGHADDHTMEIDQVSDGKYTLSGIHCALHYCILFCALQYFTGAEKCRLVSPILQVSLAFA